MKMKQAAKETKSGENIIENVLNTVESELNKDKPEANTAEKDNGASETQAEAKKSE